MSRHSTTRCPAFICFFRVCGQPDKGRCTVKIEIRNPAAYRFTGACGSCANPELVRIRVALLRVQKQAPAVPAERYGLAKKTGIYRRSSVARPGTLLPRPDKRYHNA
ncbi:arsenic metallochaperone ArsD family protein [Oryzomonas sagensis]|uniref:Arsenic metallochaperone ArsD family protein n=1 Tax=Oryzomonas sagensis TaxID=2603857 RepID=A0ABQ6TPJ3_9BACT|nr:arsenic metallochaperone ArsD family protein [Oryzomonas sagensis]